MKKKYTTPEIEIIEVKGEDIICVSNPNETPGAPMD